MSLQEHLDWLDHCCYSYCADGAVWPGTFSLDRSGDVVLLFVCSQHHSYITYRYDGVGKLLSTSYTEFE